MGTLSIALPLSAFPTLTFPAPIRPRAPRRAAPATTVPPLTRTAPDPPLPPPASAESNASRGTLDRPQTTTEASVLRTPEQVAEQEATVRLVHRCLQGDSEAWRQLVLAQHRRLYSVCFRFTGSATDAEDLTQEVFLKIYSNLPSFDAGKGSFNTWAMTLTRNLLVDHFRRTRMQRATDSLDRTLDGSADAPTLLDQMPDQRPGQDQHVAGLELRARIQGALRQLSPELREAVILRDLEDMDYKDIAKVLRVPEGTVKSRISRGRGELARILGSSQGQVA